MTLQVACVRVELGLLGPPGSQEHVFLGPLAHARGLPPHSPPPTRGRKLPCMARAKLQCLVGLTGPQVGQGQLGALSTPPSPAASSLRCTCFLSVQEVMNVAHVPSHFSVRSNKSPTVEIHVIALSGLGAVRLCKIPAQGRPQSHRHCSSHSVFLTVQGYT